MVQSASTPTPRQAFWLSHRRCAKAEGISLRAYALREGLSLQSLYATRPVTQHTSSAPPAPAGFAAVRVSGMSGCELLLPGGISLRMPEVPSAAWLAALLRDMTP